MVVPRTFPEAFGMVAAEAAACGALPVCAEHSGLAEVTRALASSLPAEARDLVSFPLTGSAVEAIAERVNAWLALPPDVRERARTALADTVSELWSWERVAEGVLAASAGRLEELPRVPQ
jgi:glycosyltransferase involved in cell wall biosynthesis